MCFFFSLIPATLFVTIGFFVLFASSKVDGGIKTFGRVLSIWIFVIALFPPIAGAYLTLSGQCPIERMMEEFGKRFPLKAK
jgi:hypothetical protein